MRPYGPDTKRERGIFGKIGKGNLKGKLDYKAMTSHIAERTGLAEGRRTYNFHAATQKKKTKKHREQLETEKG